MKQEEIRFNKEQIEWFNERGITEEKEMVELIKKARELGKKRRSRKE